MWESSDLSNNLGSTGLLQYYITPMSCRIYENYIAMLVLDIFFHYV